MFLLDTNLVSEPRRAAQGGLTVATRNTRDFRHFPVAVFDPFKHRA